MINIAVTDVNGSQEGTKLRDYITINTTVKAIGTGFFIPITKKEVNLLGIRPGDDLIVEVKVAQRMTGDDDGLNDE